MNKNKQAGKGDKWRKGTNYKKYRESVYWKEQEKRKVKI